jgi:hypothetical protein
MNEQFDDFTQTAIIAGLGELLIDQIRKLADLHKDGILTDDEFAASKQELLMRLGSLSRGSAEEPAA